MSSSLDQLKQTFFEECSEALQQIESGLTEIREGAGSDDTINAVFRSVHSVKGGAGIFGFDDLVGFAHVVETVLDAMRSGKMAPTHDIADLLLTANDILNDLIAMSGAGEAIPPDLGSECRAALERLLGDEGVGDDLPAAADFEGLDFMPVMVGDMDADDAGGKRVYRIVFRPKPDLLKKANEPLYIVRELQKLGELALTAETDGLPPLTEMEPDRPYIGWTGTLTTESTREQIEEVFEFVTDDCEIEIVEEESGRPASRLPPNKTRRRWPTRPRRPRSPRRRRPRSRRPNRPPSSSPPRPASKRRRAPRAKAVATTTRVELDKIDRVVNLVGELVITQAMLGQVVQDLPEEATGRLVAGARGSQPSHPRAEGQRHVDARAADRRGLPAHAAAGARARRQDRQEDQARNARREHRGRRPIIERLGDPLTHIIRNSADHGIETPDKRRRRRQERRRHHPPDAPSTAAAVSSSK